MIVDLKRKYRTRNGRAVELHDIVPLNSAGRLVTFPVKGSIIRVTPSGRRVPEYNIWRTDGRMSVFIVTDNDLVEII